MKKKELQSGIIAGVLWIFWIIITVKPGMLSYLFHDMTFIFTPYGLQMIGPQAATVVLILGLLINQKAIVGLACLMMVGLNGWWLFRDRPLLWMMSTETTRLLGIAHLAEALCFFVLIILLLRQEMVRGKVLFASVQAAIGQVSYLLATQTYTVSGNPGLIVPGMIMYVIAVTATAMYCARMRPEMLNELFSRARGMDISGKEYSGTTSHRTGGRNTGAGLRGNALADKDVLKTKEPLPEEKKERINNLKSLRDNGLMSKKEYEEMVDKIRRS